MYLGPYPDRGFGGAPPSIKEAKKLKQNTYEERKLMVTHGKPNRLAHPVLPNHLRAARDYRRLVANSNSSNVKKMLKIYTRMLPCLHLFYLNIVMMISSYLYQRKTEKLLTIKDPT